MELTRKQVIEELQKMLNYYSIRQDSTPEREQALTYAISSLKTDEMYQLMYEGVKHLVVIEDMRNGDVIKLMFPHYDIEIDEHKGYVRIFYEDFYTTYPLRWWSAPYKGDI